ncbi:hypothetical protein P7228_11090 [Altererythrobacter arenosus]|uniref:Uncharacterized protein n=1 Tax=Altererythrobacter arenosus TaxID=3032592 RepID=A0ABY8FNE3_9SPHN|nr:hypothetical protein [Altererythrobacter sp. CAU 1644]WFL76539.1 hypothetical protein P7228_11090 [Altererythrobacter sp. CAU 1644]
MTRRNLKFLGAAAILVLGVPALAGEITGNGKWTPVHYGKASSACAFSGLNDTPEDAMGFTQTYASFVRAFGRPAPGTGFHPGIACRG